MWHTDRHVLVMSSGCQSTIVVGALAVMLLLVAMVQIMLCSSIVTHLGLLIRHHIIPAQ
jgi:hypothetical protein